MIRSTGVERGGVGERDGGEIWVKVRVRIPLELFRVTISQYLYAGRRPGSLGDKKPRNINSIEFETRFHIAIATSSKKNHARDERETVSVKQVERHATKSCESLST